LCEHQKFLKKVEPSDVQFLWQKEDGSRTELEGEKLLAELSTTSKHPLIVRYPLSEDIGKSSCRISRIPFCPPTYVLLRIVVIKLKFINSPTIIRLLHHTGAWQELQAETKAAYDKLQKGEPYFVDMETKTIFDKEFVFSKTLERTEPNEKGERILNLLVRIKG
jgi:hypothetical protein